SWLKVKGWRLWFALAVVALVIAALAVAATILHWWPGVSNAADIAQLIGIPLAAIALLIAATQLRDAATPATSAATQAASAATAGAAAATAAERAEAAAEAQAALVLDLVLAQPTFLSLRDELAGGEIKKPDEKKQVELRRYVAAFERLGLLVDKEVVTPEVAYAFYGSRLQKL